MGAVENQGLGKLVPFSKRVRSAKRKPAPAQGKGQILLFTGVRYERDADAVPDKPRAAARPKRRRG